MHILRYYNILTHGNHSSPPVLCYLPLPPKHCSLSLFSVSPAQLFHSAFLFSSAECIYHPQISPSALEMVQLKLTGTA